MAKITIGDVKYIYNYWNLVGALDNPFDYTVNLLQENFWSYVESQKLTNNELEILFDKGRKGILYGDNITDSNPLNWSVTKYHYFSDNGSNVELFGNLKFTDGYLNNSSLINLIKVNDPTHIFDPSAKEITTTLNNSLNKLDNNNDNKLNDL